MKQLLLVVFCLFLLITSCQYPSEKLDSDKKYLSTCTDCPNIQENQDTIDFVREVQYFVSSHADKGLMYNSICDTFYKIPIKQFEVDTFLEIFEQNRGTATCGLTAQLMVKILLENNIDAYTYNFGFEGTVETHVIVLVKKDGKLFIFDPHIGYEMTDQIDNTMDIERLITSIKKGKDTISYLEQDIIIDQVLDYSIIKKKHLERLEQTNCDDSVIDLFQQKNDSIYYAKGCRSYSCDTALCYGFIPLFEKKLQKETDYHHFHEGFLLKINTVYGASDYKEIDAKLDSILTSDN